LAYDFEKINTPGLGSRVDIGLKPKTAFINTTGSAKRPFDGNTPGSGGYWPKT
jgi:hypothetical protein